MSAKNKGTYHGAQAVGIGAPPKMGVTGPMASGHGGTVNPPVIMAGRTPPGKISILKGMKAKDC